MWDYTKWILNCFIHWWFVPSSEKENNRCKTNKLFSYFYQMSKISSLSQQNDEKDYHIKTYKLVFKKKGRHTCMHKWTVSIMQLLE